MVLQNFQLRLATYQYVHVMEQYKVQYKLRTHSEPTANATAAEWATANDIPLSMGFHPQNVSFASLQDPVVAALGPYWNVGTGQLDAVAMVFPLCFFALVVATDTPFAWTRVMLCLFVLAFGKGLFGWITVEPASDGWQACRTRLESHYPVEWYAQVRSTWELFMMNPFSRVCADMMWSGHTYFVTLFACGLLECTHVALRTSSHRSRTLAVVVVFLLFLLQQSVEIYLVLRSRFHYTADVTMALFVTHLLYTNGAIAMIAQWWLYPGDAVVEKLVKEVRKSGSMNMRWFFALHSGGNVNICCHICGGSCTSHLYNSRQLNGIMDMIEVAQDGKSDGILDPWQRTLIEYEHGMVSKRIVGPAVSTMA